MKIAFVGKGGSGKTTLTAVFARHAARLGHPVVAYDADVNQHLAQSLGARGRLPAMGSRQEEIKRHLLGDNERIGSVEEMYKTSPPGRGSRLLRVREPNPVYERFSALVEGVRLMEVGEISRDDVGVRCFHGKNGVVELLLGHSVDAPDELVLVDMTAGADAFSSGLFARVNLICLVVEPTVKSLSVYDQFVAYGAEHEVPLVVVANKVEDGGDEAFVRERVGARLVAVLGRSRYVRRMERGEVPPLEELEPESRAALDALLERALAEPVDWEAYERRGHLIHLRNAESWINDGERDVSGQIDPEYSLEAEARRLLGERLVAS